MIGRGRSGRGRGRAQPIEFGGEVLNVSQEKPQSSFKIILRLIPGVIELNTSTNSRSERLSTGSNTYASGRTLLEGLEQSIATQAERKSRLFSSLLRHLLKLVAQVAKVSISRASHK